MAGYELLACIGVRQPCIDCVHRADSWGAGDLLLDVNISSMVVSEGKIVLALGAVGRMCCRASRLSASCKAAVTRELPHSNLSFAVLVCTSFTLVGFSTLGRSVDNLWCLEPL